MKFGKKLVSLAAATALVAGVGLAAAAPASAKPKVTTKGTTTIKLAPAVGQLLASVGVTVQVTSPGKASGLNLTFPIKPPVRGNVINHNGDLVFSKGGVPALTVPSPTIKLTDIPAGTGVVTAVIAGNELTVFELSGLKSKTTTKTDKKKKTRTSTTIWRGNVALTSDAGLVSLLNSILGLPDGTLQPGAPLGTVQAKIIVTRSLR